MAFNFGNKAPAPGAPASAFSFGGTPAAPTPGAPAPAAFGGGGFGATPAPAPGAPAPGGFGFGGAPAPAPGGFGAPAPAPGGFGAPAPAPGGFGAPAPAPGGFGFGGAPAPAPGGLFGSTPAPAPGGFGATPAPGLFGSNPAPAPGGSLFGKAPAPGLFGNNPAAPTLGGSMYGNNPAAQSQQIMAGAAQQVALAGHIPYANLPPHQKQAIDTLYQAMMQHKRTVLQVSTMAPKLLQPIGDPSQSANPTTSQADAAAGQDSLPLAGNVRRLQAQMQNLQQQLLHIRQRMEYTQTLFQTSTTQSIMYAKWPTEAVAMRRGVTLSKPTKSASSSQDAALQAQLKDLLDREAAHVDRVERMPSPYLWQTLEQLEKRIMELEQEMQTTHKALQEAATNAQSQDIDVVGIIKLQEQSIWKLAAALAPLHQKVDQLRLSYTRQETKENVLLEADQKEKQRQQQLDHEMRLQMVKTLPARPPAPAPGGGMFGAPAPSTGGLWGSAPAPGSSLFGGTPAPASGGLFGSTPAPGTSLFGGTPAPAAGGLFGAKTPAPGGFGAPAAGGGLFGSTPAPAPGGGLFGSPAPAAAFGAPAPAAGGGLFGATPAPAPGGFGATPAAGGFGATPAPAGGGLFGAAPAAPAAGGFGGFGAKQPAPSNTTSTPRSRNKKGGSRRR